LEGGQGCDEDQVMLVLSDSVQFGQNLGFVATRGGTLESFSYLFSTVASR
jgi:hypothetical protein